MALAEFPKKFFVTGTDTGIGKTVVSAILTKGLQATYWKPVQSGLQEPTDTERVQRLTAMPESHFREETYRLNEPLSPHASAMIDGVPITMDKFELPTFETENLIAEGAGGLLVPLNDEYLIIDLIKQLQLPVLLVARSGLGTLNHTFLSLEALRRRDIPVLGVVMNGPKNESNRRAIEHYGDMSVIAEIEPVHDFNPQTLDALFQHHFA